MERISVVALQPNIDPYPENTVSPMLPYWKK